MSWSRRIPPPLLRHSLLALVGVAAGCGAPSVDPGPCGGLLPGDVVLTELMSDPAGTDTGSEYLELHNAAQSPLPLDGLELRVARMDGTGERRHVLEGAPVLPPGGYLALGDVRDGTPLPPHLGHTYGDALGSLPNSGGRVTVACGERVLDELRYGPAGRPGVARQVDGARPPDATANDTPDSLCEAPASFADGAWGSPGRANAPCRAPADAGQDAGETAGTCREGPEGPWREVRAPAPGDLRFTEVMANPSVVDDAAGEWVELVATRSVDLHGLVLALGEGTGVPLQGEGCLPVEEGAYVLLARRAEPSLNGGLPEVRATFTLALPNTGAILTLRAGGLRVDALAFPPRGAAEAGVASQLDARALLHPAGTPDAGVPLLCDATERMPGGELGTPGAPNSECHSPVDGRADAGAPDAGTPDAGEVPAQGCLDPVTGRRRPPVPPSPGDLVIHELMANPLGADAEREYLEVYAARSVDLNGLTLATGSATGTPGARASLSSDTCLSVRAGGYALLARREEAWLNGGLPTPLALLGVGLANGAAAGEPDRTVRLWWGESLLDEVRYRTSTEGVAAQLRPQARTPWANDAPDAFCTHAEAPVYGEGGRGTPGAANACP